MKIYKYLLEPNKVGINIPVGAQILSVASQADDIVLYALVNPNEDSEKMIEYQIFGTGHQVDIATLEGYIFLGTVQMYMGTLMFHVFVRDKEVL